MSIRSSKSSSLACEKPRVSEAVLLGEQAPGVGTGARQTEDSVVGKLCKPGLLVVKSGPRRMVWGNEDRLPRDTGTGGCKARQ